MVRYWKENLLGREWDLLLQILPFRTREIECVFCVGEEDMEWVFHSTEEMKWLKSQKQRKKF